MHSLLKGQSVGLIFILFTVYSVCAQNVVQKIDSHNRMDWTRHVLISSDASAALPESHTAVDRMNAFEAAKSNAIKNLGKALFKLNIDAAQTVAEIAKTKVSVAARVRNELEKFTVTDSSSLSDMSVEMDVELPLNNGIMSIVLPGVMGGGSLRVDDIPRSPLSLLPWSECRPVPNGVELIVPSNGLLAYSGQPYSGLIINAEKLKLKPALLPRIIDEKKREVYGLNYISKESASENGIVTYVRSIQEAKKSKIAGAAPLIICAQSVSGKNLTNIIVSENDAVLIHAAAKTNNFLQQAKVIIIIKAENL